MGVFFSIEHAAVPQAEERRRAVMFFQYDEAGDADRNFVPLSFLDFIAKFHQAKNSFLGIPIIIVEPPPRQNSNPPAETLLSRPLLPAHCYSYRNINREIHQTFEISQYKVNLVRIWILKPDNVSQKTMEKVLISCRNYNFATFSASLAVRAENVFFDLPGDNSQSFASALRPQFQPQVNLNNNNNILSKTAPINIRRILSKDIVVVTQKIDTKTDHDQSDNILLPTRGSLSSNSSPMQSSSSAYLCRGKTSNMNEIDMVVPGLFISGERAARNRKLLKKLQVTHIVNLNSNESVLTSSSSDDESRPSKAAEEGGISHFNVNLDDSVFQDLNKEFWDSLEFVKEAVHSGGTVLAHCRRGISRSAALCVAFLMEDRGISFEAALEMLKKQRPLVDINQGFTDQLKAREANDFA